jgi:F-type H+-transporting ATPase subunit delta
MQLAKENSSLEELKTDVKEILKAITENNDLDSFLKSPLIKIEKKKAILEQIFKGKINDLSLRFIMQVADQKREGQLELICREFIRQYNVAHNIAKVRLTTATALDDAQREEIIKFINDNYDFSKVELDEKIDEDLIGGLILRIEDKQIDGSIKRKLQDIKQELIHA